MANKTLAINELSTQRLKLSSPRYYGNDNIVLMNKTPAKPF